MGFCKKKLNNIGFIFCNIYHLIDFMTFHGFTNVQFLWTRGAMMVLQQHIVSKIVQSWNLKNFMLSTFKHACLISKQFTSIKGVFHIRCFRWKPFVDFYDVDSSGQRPFYSTFSFFTLLPLLLPQGLHKPPTVWL